MEIGSVGTAGGQSGLWETGYNEGILSLHAHCSKISNQSMNQYECNKKRQIVRGY